MAMNEQLNVVAGVIQLSVAPVFLLTGIGALLGVMTQRLARIVDRARTVELDPGGSRGPDELAQLGQRAHWIHRAITLCVVAALLVCAVIVGLFVTAYYAWSPDLAKVVATLFAAAMLALIGGLLAFLREVQIATAVLRFSPRQ